MNRAAGKLGLDRHPLREPDRPRREGQLLDRRGSRHARRGAALRQAVPADRGDAEGEADQRATATGSSPTRNTLLLQRPDRRRRQDRPYDRRRLRPRRLREARRRAAARRRARSAERGRARRRDRAAARLRLLALRRARSPSSAATSEASRRAFATRTSRSRWSPTPGVTVEVRDDQRVRDRRRGPAEVEGPIAAGERLGRATVTVDGRFVDRVPLVAARAVAAPTVVDKIGGPAGGRADRLRRDRHTVR